MNSRELCTYVGLLGGAVAALFGGLVHIDTQPNKSRWTL